MLLYCLQWIEKKIMSHGGIPKKEERRRSHWAMMVKRIEWANHGWMSVFWIESLGWMTSCFVIYKFEI